MDSKMIDPKIEEQKYVRKPDYLKSVIPTGKNVHLLQESLKEKKLFTVCQEAKCPNLGECWAQKTATIMILGDTCTRACKFCHVKTGNPQGFIDHNEIKHTVDVVTLMDLNYVVITSVDRDDLPDHGATHFANTVLALKEKCPKTHIETLIPDFAADPVKMKILADAKPLVIAQNLETVFRLTKKVRDRRAGYEKTLTALSFYKQHDPNQKTKSSLMVGLGETQEELVQAMIDLRKAQVDILTIGQYMQPSTHHLKVERYYHPDEFKHLKDLALEQGFSFVASGPMVRSSYKAGEFLQFLGLKK